MAKKHEVVIIGGGVIGGGRAAVQPVMEELGLYIEDLVSK